MSLVVVYEAHTDTAKRASRMLRRAGLHPAVLDDPDPTVAYMSRHFPCIIRIAVPAEEAPSARGVLAAMEKGAAPVVNALDRRLRRAFLAGCAAWTVSACMLRLIQGTWERVPWLVVAAIGAAALLLVANAKGYHKPPKP